ncbi:MAG: hydrogen gas-evolving membrane-bound hydrogenase subunit E [Bacteroidota bacterium]
MTTGLFLGVLIVIAIIAPFLRRYLGNHAGWVYALWPFTGFIYYLQLLPEINQGEILIETYRWLPALDVPFSFYVDGFSLLFSLLILGIGSFIMVYAGYYMRPYPMKGRFLGYLLLFMTAMQGIVVSGNLITLFVFWELTSISSYLLIGYFHEKPEARASALQALLLTGFGGLALIGGFVLISIPYGTFEIHEILGRPEVIQNHYLYIPALILVFIGAFTKSAQFPFHFWLPGAMTAPSPVSAYLHSATMVKAGIFLLARLNPVLGGTEVWTYTLSLVGVTTMFAGAWLSTTQTDLKKILAYTTVSALGTLVLLLGTGTEYAINAAIIFLLVHALYKGTLFMMAGNIEKKTGTRDIRKLGGLFKYMPFAGVIMIMALVSMAGIPPMLGFLGKELIYEASIAAPKAHIFILVLGFTTNVILVFLSLRLTFDIFWGKEPSYPKKPLEPSIPLIMGPFFLVLFSLLLGLFPATMANPLTSNAITAISPGLDAIKLKLWHGFNLVLLLSFLTVTLGVVFFIYRHKILPLIDKINIRYFRLKFTQLFFQMIDYFLVFTKLKTKTLQHGYHRFYLMTLFLVSSVLMWVMIWRADPVMIELDFSAMPLHLIAIVFLIIAASISAVVSNSRITALISMGVIGFGISIIFIAYSGVDLAITMIMVETLMVVLAMILIYHMPKYQNFSSIGVRMRDGLIATIVGAFFMVLILQTGTSQLDVPISEYFKETSYSLAYGKNIVNVILVDYRALDTLGEITVISVAALGIYAMISISKKTKSS